WGRPEVTVPITCNGRGLRITTNLRESLCQAHSPMTLWADAVCINQAKSQEQGHGVSLMGEIYRNAKRVFVYLGLAHGNDTHGAVTLLKDVKELISRFSSIDNMSMLEPSDTLYKDTRWVSLKKMQFHPWFAPAWVIQEV
ncbi:hypothetical protein K469DRAFT_488174, partial [Zopfia rhizophila CBS 207.26]